MEVKVEIQNCDKCPYAKVEKVYTPDSFEDVRQITCTAWDNKVVHSYLDWYDNSPIPDNCPKRI